MDTHEDAHDVMVFKEVLGTLLANIQKNADSGFMVNGKRMVIPN